MNTHALSYQSPAAVISRALPQKPPMKIFKENWSHIKELTVPRLMERFKADENLVIVTDDNRLKLDPIVVMKKSRLDELTKTVDSLMSGEAFVVHEIDTIFAQVRVINELIESQESLKKSTLADAIRVLNGITVKLCSRIHVQAAPEKLKPSKTADKELLDQLPPDDAEED